MNFLTPIPWDSKVFGLDCYEVSSLEINHLKELRAVPGHFTLRINPLTCTLKIQKIGFRYVDTLIRPTCSLNGFNSFRDPDVSIYPSMTLSEVMSIASQSFVYGRYHRDCSISKELAEKRYQNWLAELYAAGKVVGLCYRGALAAFIAIDHNRLVLHSITPSMRGRGLAKYLWTPVCENLFFEGVDTIESSISAANLAVLNLYSRLGFKMSSAQDIYHLNNS